MIWTVLLFVATALAVRWWVRRRRIPAQIPLAGGRVDPFRQVPGRSARKGF